jgi:hypothetical protein
MSEQYVYSAAEELGGFLIIGVGFGLIMILFAVQFLWDAYQWWMNRRRVV